MVSPAAWAILGVMRILTLNYEYPPVGGGASPVSHQLCRQLVGLGHVVDVVTMRYRDLPAEETVDGVRIFRTPARRAQPDICRTSEMASYLTGAWRPVRRLVQANNYNVVHCHFIIPSGPLAWRAGRVGRIPFVITCHGSDVAGYNPDRFKLPHLLLTPAWRWLVERTPLIISPSMSLQALVRQHAPRARTTVIPNGIDLPEYDLRERPQPSILMCSRLLPRKGFQYALRAIKQVGLDWPVHVVGDGPYKADLEQLAGELNLPVKFWGWLDNGGAQFHELYEQCSVFVFPSESENFPTVLLEAMSAGHAIITSTAGGCPEVVGEAALLVPPRDIDSLAAALTRLRDEPARVVSLGQAARERVRQFSWDQVSRRYLACFEQVIAATGEGGKA